MVVLCFLSFITEKKSLLQYRTSLGRPIFSYLIFNSLNFIDLDLFNFKRLVGGMVVLCFFDLFNRKKACYNIRRFQ